MRTTVTLDPDVDALIRKRRHERSLTFKEAVNEALRERLTGDRERAPYATPTFDNDFGRCPGVRWRHPIGA